MNLDFRFFVTSYPNFNKVLTGLYVPELKNSIYEKKKKKKWNSKEFLHVESKNSNLILSVVL